GQWQHQGAEQERQQPGRLGDRGVAGVREDHREPQHRGDRRQPGPAEGGGDRQQPREAFRHTAAAPQPAGPTRTGPAHGHGEPLPAARQPRRVAGQRRPAPGTLRQVRLHRHRPRRVEPARLVLRQQFGRRMPGAAHASCSRSFALARRTRVFTVPGGCPAAGRTPPRSGRPARSPGSPPAAPATAAPAPRPGRRAPPRPAPGLRRTRWWYPPRRARGRDPPSGSRGDGARSPASGSRSSTTTRRRPARSVGNARPRARPPRTCPGSRCLPRPGRRSAGPAAPAATVRAVHAAAGARPGARPRPPRSARRRWGPPAAPAVSQARGEVEARGTTHPDYRSVHRDRFSISGRGHRSAREAGGVWIRRMLAPLVSGATYRRGVHLLLGGVLLLPYVLLGVAFTQLFQSQTPRGLSLLLLALTVLIAGTPAFLGATRTLEIVAARALLAVDLPDPPARPPDLEARLRSALWFAVHLITGGAVAFAMLAALPVALAFIAAQVGIGTEVLAGLQLGPLDEDDPVWWSLLGLAILVALAYAVAGLGRLAVLMAPVLLGPSAAERIAALEAEADRLAERNRLARELHDSIGHALTVTTLQAAAAGEMLDTDPEFVRRALRAVEETGRAAMADLDHVLGLLRA